VNPAATVVVLGDRPPQSEVLELLRREARVVVAGGSVETVNAAARDADGDILLFLRANRTPDPGLVRAHTEAQVISGGALVLGPVKVDDGTGTAVAGWLSERYGRRLAELSARAPVPADVEVCTLSVPRLAFSEVGGFEPGLGHWAELDLAYRLRSAGLQLVYVPNACARLLPGRGYLRLVRDAEEAGRASLALYRRRALALALADTPLGSFENGSPLNSLALRSLLRVRVAPVLLAAGCRLIERRRYADRAIGFAHEYAFWRGVQKARPGRDLWHRLTNGVTIFMYHAFGEACEPGSRYVVPARRFESQLRRLVRRGYCPITLERLAADRRAYRLPPARSFVVTMDDGYADNVSVAAPILRRFGVSATVFLVSTTVGRTSEWDATGDHKGRRLMTWDEVRTLPEYGVAVGAHTATHPHLPGLPKDTARSEIEGSRRELEQQLGRPVRTFAYPFGEMDAQTVGLVREAGFDVACGIRRGRNGAQTPLFMLRRTMVDGRCSPVRFAFLALTGDEALLSLRLHRRWKHRRIPRGLLRRRA